MLSFNLFQTLARCRDMLSVLLCLVGLQTLALQFFVVRLNFTFEASRFFVNCADSCNQPLSRCFLQMQTSDLGSNLQTGARQLAPVAQQFPGTFASRHF